MASRAGWVLYLSLLLTWIVLTMARRRGRPEAADPGERGGRNRLLVVFVAGWALVLLAIAVAWWLFRPR